MKGLMVSVQGSDCTNGGVTSGVKHVTLIGDGIAGVFEPDDHMPAVGLDYEFEPRGCRAGQLTLAKPGWLKELGRLDHPLEHFNAIGGRDAHLKCYSQQHEMVRVVARPFDMNGNILKGGMFGGNYITTSDSRFPTTAPIPVHDRFE